MIYSLVKRNESNRILTEPMMCKQQLLNKRLAYAFCISLLSVFACSLHAQAAGNPTSLLGEINEVKALDETLLVGPRAASARSQLGITKALYAQATVLPNPALEFDNGYAELSYRFGVAIPIEPPWKLVFRLLAAKAQVGTAYLQIQQLLWSLRADARRNYTQLVIAEDSAQVLRDLADLTKELTDVARKRSELGDVAKLDVFRAQLAQSLAQLDADQAERRVVQAREQLNVIMGRTEDSPLSIPKLLLFQLQATKQDLLPDLSQPLPPLSEYIAQSMQSRLEVKVVKQEIVAAKASMRTTIGNIIPNGQLSVGYDKQLNPPNGPTLRRAYLMGSFPLPIFDVQQGEIARIRATERNLKFELLSQENIVRGQVALAYRKMWIARENIRRYQDSILAESQHVAELARLSYRLGQTDITTALVAQQANIQVRNQYLTEVLNYQQAFTDLEQSIGRILQ